MGCHTPSPPQPPASPGSTGPRTEATGLRLLLVSSGSHAATPHPKEGGKKEHGDQGPRESAVR